MIYYFLFFCSSYFNLFCMHPFSNASMNFGADPSVGPISKGIFNPIRIKWVVILI